MTERFARASIDFVKTTAEILKLPANTSGTRLLNLYKKRLVIRTEVVRESGRVWVYATVQ